VLFDDYEPGSTVTAAITLLNVSDRIRQIRLTHIKAQHYKAVTLNNDINNRVAAGLSCQVQVSFTPNSRMPCEDVLVIVVEV
jgi:hypothetical protein